jgi:hypothetical protein
LLLEAICLRFMLVEIWTFLNDVKLAWLICTCLLRVVRTLGTVRRHRRFLGKLEEGWRLALSSSSGFAEFLLCWTCFHDCCLILFAGALDTRRPRRSVEPTGVEILISRPIRLSSTIQTTSDPFAVASYPTSRHSYPWYSVKSRW